MAAIDQFTRRVIVAVSIVALFYIGWQLDIVFMLLFGGLILATALRALADLLSRVVPLGERGALAAVVIGIVALLALLAWLTGGLVATQFAELRATLPRALAAAREWLQSAALGPTVLELLESTKEDGVPWARVVGVTTAAVGGIVNTVLVAAIGLYLAASPNLYVRGTLRLFPDDHRKPVQAALIAVGESLRRWLVGQSLSMALIGTLTAVGLYLLDVPLAFTLGLIAGLLAFVPFFGPIAFGVLAVVLTFTQGPQQALYVAILCFAIQQIEGYIFMPLIQRWAVALPPVLGLISVVIFGLLFGLMGVLFATPLMVALMTLVDELYVKKQRA